MKSENRRASAVSKTRERVNGIPCETKRGQDLAEVKIEEAEREMCEVRIGDIGKAKIGEVQKEK